MIGENIRKLRHTQGLTQPEFAERIGVSRNSLKIDLFKERAASILARLYHFQDKHAIAFDDEKNPWVLLGDDLSMILQDKIYTIRSVEELERYQGYLDGIERMLDLAGQQVVA